ncbi:MAG: hypothetical protein NVS2B8_00330 [Vulcanimicrobiaceae bacterium]
MRTDAALVLGRFVIPQAYGTERDPIGSIFEGYWACERANGWAVAYFTFDQASEILRASLAVMSQADFYRGRYAADLDAFVFDDGVNRLEMYEGVDYVIDGIVRRLYNLGGRGNWIWQTAAQYEGRGT